MWPGAFNSVWVFLIHFMRFSKLYFWSVLIFSANFSNMLFCHRRNLRFPNLVKMPFQKTETFFLKDTVFFIFFIFKRIFSTFNIFWPKKLVMGSEFAIECVSNGNISLRNNTIWYAFYCKFAIFGDFEKLQVFSKNPCIFLKRPKFGTFWEILPFESHFTANLQQFAEKIFVFGNLNKICFYRERNWQSSVKKPFRLRWRFCFHFVNIKAHNNSWSK